jgi:endonuclease I
LQSSSFLLVPVIFVHLGVCVCWAQEEVVFDGCDVDQYYAAFAGKDVTTWKREEVEALLLQTHRRTLPYTDSSGGDDVWKALIDLDPGDDEDTSVRLVYRQEDFPAFPFGTPDTWNREHLWPKSRGIDVSGADYTDVHNLRPADWNVNSARGNLLFGDCGIVADVTCRSPATQEAADDTATDGFVFRPPAVNRGDIARALFYMDVRYSGRGNSRESDLVLTDCPSDSSENEMAYLSQLLEWHAADPVTDAERNRSQRVCERWQGNRNIFVDFPQLVEVLFGTPKTRDEDGSYSCDFSPSTFKPAAPPSPSPEPPVSSPTSSPATEPSTNSTTLSPGDVMVVAVNSDDPDLVALVALEEIRKGVKIYVTDNAWTGTAFRTNEGTLKLTVPKTIQKGTVFGYGPDLLYGDDWQSTDGGFRLSAQGDAVLVFTFSGEEIIHLGAFSFNGPWKQANLDEDEYGTDSSALPSILDGAGSTSLPHRDNYLYTGPATGTKAAIQSSLRDSKNWNGSNSEAFGMSASSMTFKISSTSSICFNATWVITAMVAAFLLIIF